MPGPSISGVSRASRAKSREYSLISKFPLGYRNREDITNLSPGTLIVGSQNVLTNVSERVQIRQGYALDGAVSSVAAPVLSSFDWITRGNGEVHMRAGGLTSAGNDGKLQYRYDDGAANITWRDLTTALSTVAYNFTTWWNSTEALREVLYVNGTSNIFRWNGATAVILSTTANTITKTGTTTWLDAGFYSTGNKNIVINGNAYSYTGGESTTTLTGVTGNPTGEAPGSIVHQAVVTTANSAMSGITSTFTNGLIRTLNNQVFVGSLTSSVLWISKVNSYTDYTSSTPRQAGEGASLILDQNLVALEPQENFMYVSAGQDLWYNVSFELQTSTVGVTYEQVDALPLKTGRQQGALSQAFVSHMKNDVIMVSNEPTVDTFGRVESSLATPQTTNISDPIKLDMDQYDFTDGSIFYFRYYILVAIPKDGIVRIFNLNTRSWEAPLTLPISRFYIVDGELYGHSYNTFESYELFTGYADRVYPGFSGFPIAADWVFSYENYGTRSSWKSANALYIEGYINPNTVLTVTISYELDGCMTSKTFTMNGSDNQFVCIPTPDGSLGKLSLGKQKLGGAGSTSLTGLPPKFRWVPTFNNTNFFECSISFSVLGTDERFELLAFGLNAGPAKEENVKMKQ